MSGTILVGGGYYQEIAPEVSALDKGRINALEKGCDAGEFGIVQDEDLELVSDGFIDD